MLKTNRILTRGGTRPVRTMGAGVVIAAIVGAAMGAGNMALADERPQVIRLGQPAAKSQTISNYVYHSNVNGREVHLEVADGVVTRAEVDGQTIPDDRIERDGDIVRFKGEDGSVLFEHTVSTRAGDRLLMIGGIPPIPAAPAVAPLPPAAPRAWTYSLSPKYGGATTIEQAEAPAVMVGVQMVTPDASLRGHLGLAEDSATMLSAVHGGLPADKAGLNPYDVIVAIDGKSPATPADIRAVLKDKKPGDALKFTVIQKGERKDVTLNLVAWDREKLDKAEVRAIAAAGGLAEWRDVGKAFSGKFDAEARAELERRLAEGQGWLMPKPEDALLGVVPGPDGKSRTLLFQNDGPRELADMARKYAEQARAEARELRRQVEMLNPSAEMQMDQMRRQMDEMRQMLRQLMREKSGEINPEEPRNGSPNPPRLAPGEARS